MLDLVVACECAIPGVGAPGRSWVLLVVAAVALVGAGWRTHRAMERTGSQHD